MPDQPAFRVFIDPEARARLARALDRCPQCGGPAHLGFGCARCQQGWCACGGKTESFLLSVCLFCQQRYQEMHGRPYPGGLS